MNHKAIMQEISDEFVSVPFVISSPITNVFLFALISIDLNSVNSNVKLRKSVRSRTLYASLLGIAEPLTSRQHFYAWRHFVFFCIRLSFCFLPAAEDTVSAYLAWVCQWEVTDQTNKSAVTSAKSALNFVHCKLNDLESPCKGFLCQLITRAFVAERDRPAVQKEFIPMGVAKAA